VTHGAVEQQEVAGPGPPRRWAALTVPAVGGADCAGGGEAEREAGG